jgi:fumarate reductase subunit D
MGRSGSTRGRTTRSGIASIIFGILGIVFALVEPTLALICGLLGLYFGLVARAGRPRWMASAGLVINGVALVLVTSIIANVFP